MTEKTYELKLKDCKVIWTGNKHNATDFDVNIPAIEVDGLVREMIEFLNMNPCYRANQYKVWIEEPEEQPNYDAIIKSKDDEIEKLKQDLKSALRIHFTSPRSQDVKEDRISKLEEEVKHMKDLILYLQGVIDGMQRPANITVSKDTSDSYPKSPSIWC